MRHMHRQQQNPHDLGQQYDLGEFQAMYHISRALHYFSNIFIFFYIIFFVLSALILPFVLLTYPASMFTAFVSLGFCLLLIILLRNSLKRGWPCAFVYENGFICGTTQGKIQRVVRWTDIESFVRRLTGGTGQSMPYTVCSVILKADPTPLDLNQQIGKRFIQAIESVVVTRLYPSVQAAYLSGDIVHFGRLEVSQEGLSDTKKGTKLLWSDVESIRMSKPIFGAHGSTRIKKSGKKRPWASIALGEFENTGVFCRLLATDIVPIHSVRLLF